MVRKQENTISLLITSAEVKWVKLETNGDVTVEVALMAGEKRVTSMYLYHSKYHDKKSVDYIERPPEVERIQKELFDIVRTHANISIERIQNMLPEGRREAEAEVVE